MQPERKAAMEWYLMAWRKYAEFDGRSRRKEYWMFALFNILAVFALSALATGGAAILATRGTDVSENGLILLFIPIGIYGLAITIPSLAVATRRFHDIGKSGWLLFLLIALGVIPFVGFITAIIQIVFLCQDGVPGVNQYGPNPKFPMQGAMVYAGNAGFIPAGIAVPPQQFVAGPPQQFAAAQPQQPPVAASLGFCRNCGAQLTDGSPFCGNCGTRI
jgi:uncharacterized membrane protein YhaH (DUF805 family)